MAEAELLAKLEGTRRRRRRREEKELGGYEDEIEWNLVEEDIIRSDMLEEPPTITRGKVVGQMLER